MLLPELTPCVVSEFEKNWNAKEDKAKSMHVHMLQLVKGTCWNKATVIGQ